MAKFNTNSIKEHFINFILKVDEETKEQLSFCYFHNPKNGKLDEEDLETVAGHAKDFKVANDPLVVADYFYKEFCNIKRWKRDSKQIGKYQEDFDSHIDVCGEINSNIKPLKDNDPIIIRTFMPKNEQLSDNFRLEFITLADDSDFVYWTIIVD
jgi:hypothetical protein